MELGDDAKVSMGRIRRRLHDGGLEVEKAWHPWSKVEGAIDPATRFEKLYRVGGEAFPQHLASQPKQIDGGLIDAAVGNAIAPFPENADPAR